MSYKLEKPFNKNQKNNFIVEYNHNKGLNIEETQHAIYALEPWEIIKDGSVFDNTEQWQTEQAEKKRQFDIQKIKSELAELDSKRIRAICENETKDAETGETWLDYYNNQIRELRSQLASL